MMQAVFRQLSLIEELVRYVYIYERAAVKVNIMRLYCQTLFELRQTQYTDPLF